MNSAIQFVGALHDRAVFKRRTATLARLVHELAPPCASMLDVGCGDGAIDAALMQLRPDISIGGLDLFVRPKAFIPVEVFDGARLPCPDKSWDVVMMIDVLHHTDDPRILLAEACRVARIGVIIKDHNCRTGVDRKILKFMDWVSNRSHNVRLTYNYWPLEKWETEWKEMGLNIVEIRTRLKLYPFWARPFFESNLHFAAMLTRSKS